MNATSREDGPVPEPSLEHKDSEVPRRPLGPAWPTWIERAAVLLLLLAALVPRARDISSTFDREFEGFQGTFFTVIAVNYERLGVGRYGGYPTFNGDLPTEPDVLPYLYPNHPPTVPLLGWVTLHLFAPEGWSEAWREGRPPDDIEGIVRVPFLALHVLALYALWWSVRQTRGGARLALLTLAFAAAMPVSALYATLVNYENPCAPFLLFACGWHLRYLRGGGRRELAHTGLHLFLAAAVTFTPLFYLPFLSLQVLYHRGLRRALVHGLVTGGAVFAPILIHGLWVRAVLPQNKASSVFERARMLMGPLFDGTAPLSEWCVRQWTRMSYFMGELLVIAAVLGLLWYLAGLVRSRRDAKDLDRRQRAEGASLLVPFLGGGFGILIGFYTHTFDGAGAEDGQTVFLLNLVPAICLAAAMLVDALAPSLARLRGGLAPLVVLVSLIAMPGVARMNHIRHRWRAPGPLDDPSLTEGPSTPLPATRGRQIAEILPIGAVGLVPPGLGITPATGYYAWRTLIPADEASWGQALTIVREAYGLTENPIFYLVPKDPPSHATDRVAAIRAALEQHYSMVDEDVRWELWRVRD